MIFKQGMNLLDFRFSEQARRNVNLFSDDELSAIEELLMHDYPNGMDAKFLDNYFRFDADILAALIFGWEGDSFEIADHWEKFRSFRLNGREQMKVETA